MSDPFAPLFGRPENMLRLHYGVVAGTAPLTVDVAGGTVDADRSTAYSPTLGDNVAVLVDGGLVFIINKVT